MAAAYATVFHNIERQEQTELKHCVTYETADTNTTHLARHYVLAHQAAAKPPMLNLENALPPDKPELLLLKTKVSKAPHCTSADKNNQANTYTVIQHELDSTRQNTYLCHSKRKSARCH